MSDIQFACPHCGLGLSVEAEDAGTELECPECGGQMMAPAPEPEEAAPQRTPKLKTRPRTTIQVPRTRKPSASRPAPAPTLAPNKGKPLIIAIVVAAILGGGTQDFIANAIYDQFFRTSDQGFGASLAIILIGIGTMIVGLIFAVFGAGTLELGSNDS